MIRTDGPNDECINFIIGALGTAAGAAMAVAARGDPDALAHPTEERISAIIRTRIGQAGPTWDNLRIIWIDALDILVQELRNA